jgi:hypothetical protein
MELNHHDQERIRDYLLGHLSNEEQQKIEERLMVEDDLFEEFEISKGELIEKYRAGELKQQETNWFESHYLASPEGRQRLTFAVALNCLKHPTQPKQITWFQRFRSFIKQPRWVLATAAPVSVMAAIVLMVSFSHSSTPTTLSVSLDATTSNRATSGNKYRRISLTPDVGEVKFDLALPASITPAAKYRVDLDDRSRNPRTLNVASNDTRAVSVVIPAADLPSGLYALKLFAINADGAEQRVGEYFFEVAK